MQEHGYLCNRGRHFVLYQSGLMPFHAERPKKINEEAALGLGMKEKAEEFVAAGGEIYRGTNT